MEAATFVLLGLRHEEEFIEQLFQGVQEMEESTTYQHILRRGKELGDTEARRDMILQMGRRKFGEPTAAQVQSLEGISHRERLKELTDRLLDAASWHELLS